MMESPTKKVPSMLAVRRVSEGGKRVRLIVWVHALVDSKARNVVRMYIFIYIDSFHNIN